MSETEDRIARLEQRLQAAEDQLAIQNLIVRYGLAVDLGDAEGVAGVFKPDAEFDVGGGSSWADSRDIVFRGHEEIKNGLVLGEGHQSLLPNCAHTIGPAIIKVDGDRAEATGYSRIYHRQNKGEADDRIHLFRIGYNRWELERQPDGGWLIARRISRVLGEEAAHDVFRRGLL
ncbi:nuclear transport factor 2 family protein [Myxococcota bacterium]|nr:nuclear transport factor 2 family protein [Myxococcota bacterium]